MASHDRPVELSKPSPLHDARDPEEDWTGVKDPVKRRKLQNRLHQRAWRRRKAEERRQSRVTKAASEASIAEEEKAAQERAMIQHRRQSRDELHLTPMSMLASVIKFNVYLAFQSNSDALGFGETWEEIDAVSPFFTSPADDPRLAPENYPSPLRPTQLQRTVKHHAWIDLLPAPAMRDSILRRGADFDDEPLRFDILDDTEDGRYGLLVWGQSWEPACWEVSEGFARKWFWVVQSCHELLRATNAWRARRGEPELFPDSVCNPPDDTSRVNDSAS
ncbi:uncharacterized protein PV09_07237 [Verruconis gallopava]|uniref:BZIP domain-containing protein n=1 Tax=Verruconis gallopava TaxID=253628 RepID=A0A0D2AQQ5_9PEZI|nr:uncharacterized protein PV09_07237 [Verruconis gallopava]KIW01484.1 hypothetical protein PV09_07237 [Verruconis gallopava]